MRELDLERFEISANTTSSEWPLPIGTPRFDEAAIMAAIRAISHPLCVVREESSRRVGVLLEGLAPDGGYGGRGLSLVAKLPAASTGLLGDATFLADHSVGAAYAAGEMASGIGSTAIVIAMARAGLLGFFGAAGLPLPRVEAAIGDIERALGRDAPGWGVNLIHSPGDRRQEEALVELLLRRGVRRTSASAFFALTPAIVRYSASGLGVDSHGNVVRRNHLFAKLSRLEVARQFLSPAPPELLAALVEAEKLTPLEARLAATVPVAQDITVEADSAGHTDNRPLVALLPAVAALRDQLCREHGYSRPVRIGAAGGLATPAAVAGAFAMGAAYVLTGSINQSTVEAGTSDAVKRMLAAADMTDVMMAPAADMFEMGVKVQVLKRGTMFGVRAQLLHQLYLAHDSLEAIPPLMKARLEREHFQKPLAQAWKDVERFFAERDPEELERAAGDSKHKLALLFRSYLGQASRWAITGEPSRRMDYQVWCGPSMGAFNAWVKGSFLDDPARRTVVQIARNLLAGAAQVGRAQQARTAGVPVPPAAFTFVPQELS